MRMLLSLRHTRRGTYQMSEEVNVKKQPVVFVTIELWVRDTIDPLVAGDLIGEELVSMKEKGCEITHIDFVRGIAGTPMMEDEDDD